MPRFPVLFVTSASNGHRKVSEDNRRNVRLHHALHTELLGDSVQFIKIELLVTPRLHQRFERHVKADFVPEPKAMSALT